MASIFSRIIAGEIPCYKVYENDRVFAFLDINPIQPGHTLIVPKHEIDNYIDASDTDYLAVMSAAKKIAHALKRITGKNRICTMIQGFDVPHFHYHLIPANNSSEFSAPPRKLSDEEMKSIQHQIIEQLNKHGEETYI